MEGVASGSRKRLWLIRLLMGCLTLVAIEALCRAYWTVSVDVPFFRTDRLMLTMFYPEASTVQGQEIRRGNGSFDVLLLGASVIDAKLGNVGNFLEKQLQRETHRRVKIYNVAAAAHNSLDSLHKYRLLDDQEFDLVIVYHGINETRANNCPTEVFRNDYSHYGWYRRVNQLAAHPEVGWFVLPFTASRFLLLARDALWPPEEVPIHRPNPEWLKYGSDYKTVEPFRANVMSIASLAHERGQELLLISFAVHPEHAGVKPTGISRHYTGLWGDFDNVIGAVAAHNRTLEEIADTDPAVAFLDINARMPKRDRFFDDICHFTEIGAQVFARIVADGVAPLVLASDEGAVLDVPE
jgi:lysophospholipase L1-like esterase